MRAFAPNGRPIVGIVEQVITVYALDPRGFDRHPDGGIDFDYAGTESTTDWDGAEPIKKDGKLVFVDDAGGECPEDQVVLKGDEEA